MQTSIFSEKWYAASLAVKAREEGRVTSVATEPEQQVIVERDDLGGLTSQALHLLEPFQTVEEGLHLAARIEDMVLVKDDSYELLSCFSLDVIECWIPY